MWSTPILLGLLRCGNTLTAKIFLLEFRFEVHAQGYGCHTSASVMCEATLSIVLLSSIVEHVKEQARIVITLRCRKAKKDIAEVIISWMGQESLRTKTMRLATYAMMLPP